MRVVVRLVVLTMVLAMSVVAVAPVVAAPASAPAPALPPPPNTFLGSHTVQAGETLDCIGRAYSVDPNAIAQVNGTSTPAQGQVLKIPAVPWFNIPAGTTCASRGTGRMDGMWPGRSRPWATAASGLSRPPKS